ncbi:MAG: inorganic phosphate transporter [Rhodanobacteraceae bacterium]|nr:MAG: inorganic phosphate transporter [Rhodanobacteraceae bacterium]
MQILLLAAVLFLATTNGANDNFKGVAALYGSRVAGYWTSLGWASVTTLAGSLCSVFLAGALFRTFTGAGLVPDAAAAQTGFALAVAAGAAITIAAGSWRGLPISTTHALVGAMCGAGLVAVGGDNVHFAALGKTFLLPLLASPLIAIIPAWIIAPWLRKLAARGARDPECICRTAAVIGVTPDGVQWRSSAEPMRASSAECAIHGARPNIWRSDARGAVNALLFLSGGAVSFARGLNDTPKIAALLLPIALLDGGSAVLAVGVAMLIGGVIGARRVARTMSDKITTLDLGAALAASLTTGLLVGTASVSGLPVSTTHVAVGALTGAGANGGGGVDRKVMTHIALSWIITLPIGALFGALVYWAAG